MSQPQFDSADATQQAGSPDQGAGFNGLTGPPRSCGLTTELRELRSSARRIPIEHPSVAGDLANMLFTNEGTRDFFIAEPLVGFPSACGVYLPPPGQSFSSSQLEKLEKHRCNPPIQSVPVGENQILLSICSSTSRQFIILNFSENDDLTEMLCRAFTEHRGSKGALFVPYSLPQLATLENTLARYAQDGQVPLISLGIHPVAPHSVIVVFRDTKLHRSPDLSPAPSWHHLVVTLSAEEFQKFKTHQQP